MARRGDDSTLVTAAALGALSGMRSMAAPRLVARVLQKGKRSSAGSGLTRTAARFVSLAAAGEMLADKSPWIPDRTATLPLAGRALLGSLSAVAYAHHRRHPLLSHGAVGAAAAVISTFAAFHVRRMAKEHLNVPDAIVA
jgi:uncharacterized membrane protein